MNIFSKLKATVQGHIPSKSGSTPLDSSSSLSDSNIDDILRSDPTAEFSKSSKVLEASANADYSGGMGIDTNTPFNPPNQIVRDMQTMGTMGQQTFPNISSESGMSMPSNPTQNAYPSDQTVMAQASYPSSQAAANPYGIDSSLSSNSQNGMGDIDNVNMGMLPQSFSQLQQPAQQPISQQQSFQPMSQPQQQYQSIYPSMSRGDVPESPQPAKSVADIQQQNTDGMRRLDISLELRGLKEQISLIIEKLNVIEERTRRFSY
ncbi:MAG: hypothetical protein K0B07_03055 [DPANN group archaeon]|nr:hypothetical protein [DPANN group archaeon]